MLRGGETSGGASWRTRRGLAPLELVLCLFFLLVMMSLIINFGTTAPWHLRGQIAARNAVWRSLAIRTGNGNRPNPSNWWAPATMGLAPPRPLTTVPNDMVGQLWSQGDLMQPALRGPTLMNSGSGQQGQQAVPILMNNLQYLEMVNQALIGTGNLTKAMPLLPNMRKARINPMQPVFDDFWRFQDMSPKTNNWAMRNNGDWRLIQWYLFEASQLQDGDVQNAYMQYKMTDQNIQQSPGIMALLTLDRDDEFIAAGQTPPDFYPRVSNQCQVSPQTMQQNLVMPPNGVIAQIQGPRGGGKGGVPDNMAKAFIALYQQQLQAYQAQQPPNQGMIDSLQQKIQQLQQFQGTLN